MHNKGIYSYIKNQLVDPSDNSIKFDPDRYKNHNYYSKSLTLGTLLKRIILFIIFAAIAVTIYTHTSHFNRVSAHKTISFVDTTSDIDENCSDIIDKITTHYNNNDFSDSYKNELRQDLAKLQNYTMDDVTDTKFSTMKSNCNDILSKTKSCINLILSKNKADDQLSQGLSNRIDSINSDLKSNKVMLIQYLQDNHIPYEVDNEHNKIHFHITYSD